MIIDAPIVPFNEDFELADLLEQNTAVSDLETKKQGEIILSVNKGKDLIYYDCERFYQADAEQFLLVYRVSGDLTTAIRDIRALGERQIDAGAIWEGCFSSLQNYYIFVDQMMSDSIIAASRAQLYEDNYNLKLSIKKIEPTYLNQNN